MQRVVVYGETRADGVNMAYERLGRDLTVKIKTDPYYGVDQAKCEDLSLPFYRADVGALALQSMAHHVSREPGWALTSPADELFYYTLVVDQTEGEVLDLLDGPDEEFMPAIRVVRDDLRIVPMSELNRWFEQNQEEYPSRPAQDGDHSAWYRIVPRIEFDRALPSVRHVGSIYRT